jgi:hypothetical protein
MAYDANNQNVVLFGGTNGTNLQDTYTWDGTSWTSLNPTTKPSTRADATMVYDTATRNVVMFSGIASTTYRTDTYTWDGINWTLKSPSTSPNSRRSAVMAYDAVTGNVVLFGGYHSNALSDTWVWNGTTWTQPTLASPPTARGWAAGTYDSVRGAVVMFGGSTASTSGFLSETWTYVQDTFVAPTTAIGSAAAQTPVYFNITGSGTLPALSNSNVVLQGVSGKDFTLGTSSTCAGAMTAGSTCVVNVAFTPSAPGARQGAVNLLDNSNNVLATAYISGVGTGPLATLSPGVISTIAGTGAQCPHPYTTCGDGGTATLAYLDDPEGMVIDNSGNVFIADTGDDRIREVAAGSGTITTVVGTGMPCATGTDGCGDGNGATTYSVELNNPSDLAMDGAGDLYIADTFDNRIREVNAAGIISTIAGTGNACSTPTAACGDGGAAISAQLGYPVGVAVDGAGNVYIADNGANRIRKVLAGTGTIITVAGNGSPCAGNASVCGDGGPATSAQFDGVARMAIDAAGNLYIADIDDNRIREVTAGTGVITTVAGTGFSCSSPTASCGDGGAATSAQLHGPSSVAVDAAGNLYIFDHDDVRIRKVAVATGVITTIAGTGTECGSLTGTCGDGGPATAAQLRSLGYVALDGAGHLYIADTPDNRVREVTVTSAINFATTTTAGTADTADGTETATLNNVGNSALTIADMENNGVSGFVLGNPLSGGCSTSVNLAAGDSCLLGEQFSPAVGAPALVVGSLAVTDNSLNAGSAVQYVPLTGTTVAGGLVVTVGQESAVAGTSSVTLAATVGYGGSSLPTGAVTFMVNGDATGVGTVTCKAKASHLNCTATYDASALTAGNYTIEADVEADGNYSAASGTSTLYVTGVSSGVHVSPVTMVVAAPAAPASVARVARTGTVVAAAPAVVVAAPEIVAPAMTEDAPQTCADADKDSSGTCVSKATPQQ